MIEKNEYSPGVHKLLKHLEHLQKITNNKPTAPLHISIFPNTECQLNCSYCCGRNMKNQLGELSIQKFKKIINILKKYGTKAIEFSGVIGEPLLWKHINEGVSYAKRKGLSLSLITNGLALSKIPKETLSKFSWIRVSLQSVKHAKKIEWFNIPTKINGSFIVYNEKSFDELEKLHEFAKKNNTIIRIATAKPSSIEWEQKVEEETKRLGKPFFFGKKEFGKPLGCYMAYVRAAIDWNGNLLPCPSVELNIDNLGMIPENFILCNASNLKKWILKNPPKDLGFRCNFCNCGKEENDFIYNLLQEVEDVNFV